MILPIQLEKIVGQSTDSVSSAVFVRKIQPGFLSSIQNLPEVDTALNGTVTVACSILVKNTNPPAFEDLEELSKEVFEILCKSLEGASEGDAPTVLTRLRMAKEAVLAHLQNYPDLQAHFVFVMYIDDVCYIARVGKDVVFWVFANGSFGELTIELGSGPLHSGDVHLACTKTFLELFKPSEFSTERVFDLQGLIDGFTTEVLAHPKQAEIAALFVNVQEDVKEAVGEKLQAYDRPSSVLPVTETVVLTPAEVSSTSPARGTKRIPMKISAFVFSLWQFLVRELFVLKDKQGWIVSRFRRNIIVLAVVVLMILGLSVGFTLWQKQNREKDGQFAQYVSEATAKYREAEALADLNKNKARELLLSADRTMKLALVLNDRDERTKKLALDISQLLKKTETVGSISFEDFATFDSFIVGLVGNDKNIVAITENGAESIVKTSKQVSSAATGNTLEKGTLFDNKLFVISGRDVLSGEADFSSEQLKLTSIAKSPEAQDIAVFAGNVYLLSKSKIDKFVPIADGYSQVANYLESSETFSDSSRFAIDGSIWVSRGADILKFTRGKRENFAISGSIAGIGSLGSIYTTVDIDSLYIVDIQNSALLVISKEGVFKRAYQSSEFGKANGIVIDEAGRTMYLAVGPKILKAPLE